MANHQKPQSLYNPETGIYTSPRPPISLPQLPSNSIVDFLFHNLSDYSDRPALIDPHSHEIITFSQLKQKVSQFAEALCYTYKISKGDVVLILSPNSILFTIAFLAVTSIGAIVTTAYNVDELSHQISDSKPKLIIMVEHLFSLVNGFDLPILDLNSSSDLVINYHELVCNGIFTTRHPPVSQNDVAAILYFSGTTGVVFTHGSLMATALMVTSDQDLYKDGRSVFLCMVPLFHVMGLITFTYSQIMDAAVIPYPDKDACEIPMAYVVRKPETSITGEEVEIPIAKQVAPFKRIRKVAFIDVIPKAASGKILRRELRDKVRSKL